ncbi:MAG: hypothetical protein DRP71_08765 [Verrucomicrobia bacterium]|nr:MAG: hypothetical protein DRP71_08765 [Verrucomicrobiota bacterium]
MRFSIRNKIITYVAIPVAAICIGAMVWTLSYVRNEAQAAIREKLAEDATVFASRFEDYIGKAARVAETTAGFMEATDDLGEEALYAILRSNVSRNRRVYGAAIAFEPKTLFSDDRLFCPYVHRDGDDLRQMDINREVLDWYEEDRWQWWHRAKEAGHGIWTDPYFDQGAGNALMVTYSTPFTRNGRFAGVTTVDMSPPGLRETVAGEILGGQAFDILTADGRFVYSPNADSIMGQTVQDKVTAIGREDLIPLIERMLNRSSGTEQTAGIYGSEPFLIAHAKIPSTGWTLVTYTPESVAYAEYRDKIAWVTTPFLITLLLIVGCVLLVARRLADPIRTLRRHAMGIASGNLGVDRFQIDSNDEIGDLAEAFSEMQDKVADREAQLRDARETSLAQLLESAPDGMVVVDKQGRIRRCNSTVERIFGFPLGPDEMRGGNINFLDLLVEEDDHPVIKELGDWIRAPETLKPSTALHLNGRRRDGTEFPIDVTLSPFREPDGRRVVMAIRDVTAQKNAEQTLARAKEEAEVANHAKSQFLASMSHELRTPLNGVLGYAQILQRDTDATPTQKEQLDAIINCGDHLLHLINDVLDLSKIEAGGMEIDIGPCDLHHLVKSVGNISSHRAADKGLQFSVDVASEVPRGILTDGSKLRQILVNLLGNAVKFTEEGGVALRVAEIPKGFLQLEVEDTGVGIPADQLNDVFDPFKQLDAGKAAGGTGLGLAISRQLVESLGGTLILTSEPGKGSCFRVSLPLEEVDEVELDRQTTSHDDEGPSIRAAPGREVTILVADDRKTNRDVLTKLLSDVGFRVIEADDGDVAVEQIRETRPHAALLDIRMPRLNGIDALKLVRSDPQISDTVVIAVTASVFPEFRRKALAAGFDDFLGKPFKAPALFALLVKHLAPDLLVTETAVSRESVNPASEESEEADTAEPLPSTVIEELAKAVAIRSLTAVNRISEKLIRDSTHHVTAIRIRDLARKFDFASLADLVSDLKKQSDTR